MNTIRRRDLVALLGYILLSIVLTYPLILHFTTHVTGDGSDDPALAWNLWWVRYALLDLGRSPIYTDAMFYPIGLNLAFYTVTYLNAFLSIPIQFAFGLVSAANLNLLFSFALSGWGTYLLIGYLLKQGADGTERTRALAAFAGGCLYAFSANKFLYASLGQFNIASSQWIPFYILFLFKLTRSAKLTDCKEPSTFGTSPHSLRSGTTLLSRDNLQALAHPPTHFVRGLRCHLGTTLRYGFLLGLFLLFQALSEMIFASFLIIFTFVYLVYWIIAKRPRSAVHYKQPAIGLIVAAVTFALPMLPILVAMIQDTLAEGDFIQSGLGFSDVFSTDLLGFFVPSHLQPLFGNLASQFHFSYINFGYLGFVALALAFLALWKIPQARVWGIFAALMLLITLGPDLRINGQAYNLPLPFNLLLQIPFIKGNRYPSRWSVMLTLCLAVMVGCAVAWVLTQVKRIKLKGKGTGALLAFSILLFALLFEHLSFPLPLSNFQIPAIYNQIARESGDFSVLEIPVAWRNGFRVTGSYRNGSQGPIDRIFMLAQWDQTTQHHPILNGNTSRNPELKFQYFTETPVLDSLIAIQEGHTLSPEIQKRDAALAPQLLSFFNTRYVIWHAPYEDANRAVAERTRGYLEQIFPATKIAEEYENGQGIVVYRVDDGLPVTPPDVRADSPLARLNFAEGWGAFDANNRSLFAQRREAKLFLPLSSIPSNARLAIHSSLPTDGQRVQVTVNGRVIGVFTMSSAQMDYALDVPDGILQTGMNDIIFTFDKLSPVRDPRSFCRGETQGPVGWGGALVVRSAGEEQGAFGHIYVGGVDESTNARGYNLVVLDKSTFVVQACGHFDTFASSDESARMAQFIAQIPDGDIVAVAASDEASQNLTQDGVNALHSIGAAADLRGKFRWSHALVGTKGAAPGTAAEAASEFQVSQVILGSGLTEPNIAAEFDEIRIEGK